MSNKARDRRRKVNACLRRYRARKRAALLTDLASKGLPPPPGPGHPTNIARGLPPAKTGAERIAAFRVRQREQLAVEKARFAETTWYAPGFASKEDIHAFLKGRYPADTDVQITAAVEGLIAQAHRYNLRINQFVCINGIPATRAARAILYQAWLSISPELFLDDVSKALREAQTRAKVTLDRDAHPNQQRSELASILDVSQAFISDGRFLIGKQVSTR